MGSEKSSTVVKPSAPSAQVLVSDAISKEVSLNTSNETIAPTVGFGLSSGSNMFGSSGPTLSQSNFQSPFGKPLGPISTSTSLAPSKTSPFGGNLSSTNSVPSSSTGQPQTSFLNTSNVNIQGKTPRDILVEFYKQRNPSKINEIPKLLAKYAGNEEQLFRNLAKKYNIDPAQFGVSSSAPPPSNFGSPTGINPSPSPF